MKSEILKGGSVKLFERDFPFTFHKRPGRIAKNDCRYVVVLRDETGAHIDCEQFDQTVRRMIDPEQQGEGPEIFSAYCAAHPAFKDFIRENLPYLFHADIIPEEDRKLGTDIIMTEEEMITVFRSCWVGAMDRLFQSIEAEAAYKAGYRLISQAMSTKQKAPQLHIFGMTFDLDCIYRPFTPPDEEIPDTMIWTVRLRDMNGDFVDEALFDIDGLRPYIVAAQKKDAALLNAYCKTHPNFLIEIKKFITLIFLRKEDPAKFKNQLFGIAPEHLPHDFRHLWLNFLSQEIEIRGNAAREKALPKAFGITL